MEPRSMRFDPERVRLNVRSADTHDLLDRITVYRSGLEQEAIRIIEEELRERGVGRAEIYAHKQTLDEKCLRTAGGAVVSCSFCRRPAVAEGWGWFCLWRKLPLFPRKQRYCAEHAPN